MQSSIETYRLHNGVLRGEARCWPLRIRPPPLPPSRIGRLFGSCRSPSDRLDPHMIIALSRSVRSPSLIDCRRVSRYANCSTCQRVMILYELIFCSCRPWCDEEWWFSLTPSRQEKLRGDTSLANMKVMFRVASVQNASTIRSSISRTSLGGSIRGPPGTVALSPPLSRLVNSMAGRGMAGGGIRLSGRVGGRHLLVAL